jgi:hypothetical protein
VSRAARSGPKKLDGGSSEAGVVLFAGSGNRGWTGGFAVDSNDSNATMFWHLALMSSNVRSSVGRVARARAKEVADAVREVCR